MSGEQGAVPNIHGDQDRMQKRSTSRSPREVERPELRPWSGTYGVGALRLFNLSWLLWNCLCPCLKSSGDVDGTEKKDHEIRRPVFHRWRHPRNRDVFKKVYSPTHCEVLLVVFFLP